VILFSQDDENHDPQWSFEQCVAAQLKMGGTLIGPDELEIMRKTTVTVFEVLEKCWSSLDCSLIDMKIEFGVDSQTGKYPQRKWWFTCQVDQYCLIFTCNFQVN
jgi:phosphoribosylaminoimidazole carboxylase/phosphoribosylaminoimidazole-succinocarboxamide synthase